MKGTVQYSHANNYYNYLPFTVSFLYSRTPMDFAVMNGHVDCVDILTQAGALATDGIRALAAVSIQSAYRAYRYCKNSL